MKILRPLLVLSLFPAFAIADEFDSTILPLLDEFCLKCHSTAEQKGDFEAAAGYYREALALEPMQQDAWYFIHNNLGFSFNQMGRFAEGEKCCRAAIEICFARPNGHKNLGMALSGQGRFREAAQSYHTAMKVAPDDPRSFDLLRNLLREHPELRNDFGHGLR